MEYTGFGLNLVSGNYEFASLIVIDDEEFWARRGGQVEANWESSTLRRYSSLDNSPMDKIHAGVDAVQSAQAFGHQTCGERPPLTV